MGTAYDDLSNAAGDLYDLAVEKYLWQKYSITKRGDSFYSPKDDPSGLGSTVEDRYTQSELEDKVAEAVGKFEDIPTLFDRFTSMPHPDDFEASITDMAATMRSLSVGQSGVADPITGVSYPYNTDLKDLSTSAGYLDEWDGIAMMTFRDEFIAKFEERVLNQFNAAAVIKNAWGAEQEMWRRARSNVCAIVDDGKTGLESMGDCGKNEWTIALSVVGAVVAIGAAVAVSGGTAAIALAAVGAAGSVGSSVAGTIEDPPEPKYNGETVEAVMNEVRQGVRDFEDGLKRTEDKIKSACDSAKGTLESQKEDYVAPKPALLDGGTVGKPDAD